MEKHVHINVRPSQTKIIATIGPASAPKEVLKKMFIEGIDACRLNFSHGTHQDHLKSIQTILKINSELNTNVAIIADLQGPKLRVGEMQEDGVELKEGSIVTFTNKECLGTADKVYMSYSHFAKDVEKGENILIDDGKLKLQVIETNRKDMVKARVVYGGVLSSRKGVNLPDTNISQPSLTEKDIQDTEFILKHDVDWLALSFVRSVTDIIELRNLIRKAKKNTGIIAKIEKPEALKEIDEIIDATNAVMVARGDLGVEVPFDRVPLIQKELVNKSIAHGKPVIIATQMMESQITNFNPTRAEANDVANAVLDGADVLMLSGETSVGRYPVQVIRNMQRIIDHTEKNGCCFYRDHCPQEGTPAFLPDSVCFSATHLARQTKAKAIITFTHSGYTAYKISSYRPQTDIYAFTANKNILRKMSLLWGVRAFEFNQKEDIEEAIRESIKFLKNNELIIEGDVVVHVGSTPVAQKGQANTVRLSYV
jgi:pyruvate kinase